MRRREVLLDREVEGDGEGRLLLLPAVEGRPVALREDREADADQEEGGGHSGVSRMASQRQRREAERDRSISRCPLQQEKHRAQEPCTDDGRDERDEARKKDQRHGGARLGRQTLLVEVAAEQGDDDDCERAEGGSVQRGEGAPAEGDRLGPQGGEEHERERGGDRQSGQEARGRERRVCQHVTDRRPCPRGNRGSGNRSQRPTDEGSADCDHRRLHAREDRELPAPGAEPREPLPCRLAVTAHTHGGEDREGEEERRGLAAHQEEPAPGDAARLCSSPQLFDGRGEVECARRCLERRAGPDRIPGQPVDLPGPDRSVFERRHPCVAAVHGVEPRG